MPIVIGLLACAGDPARPSPEIRHAQLAGKPESSTPLERAPAAEPRSTVARDDPWAAQQAQRAEWEARLERSSVPEGFVLLCDIGRLLAPARDEGSGLRKSALNWRDAQLSRWLARARASWGDAETIGAGALELARALLLQRFDAHAGADLDAQTTEIVHAYLSAISGLQQGTASRPLARMHGAVSALLRLDSLSPALCAGPVDRALHGLSATSRELGAGPEPSVLHESARVLLGPAFEEARRDPERLGDCVRIAAGLAALESLASEERLSAGEAAGLLTARAVDLRLLARGEADAAGRLVPGIVRQLAVQLRRRATGFPDERDRLVFTAAADTLSAEENFACLAHLESMRLAVRRLPQSGTTRAQIAALQLLARRHFAETSLATRIASRLAVPFGAPIAREAEEQAAAGAPASAALLYLQALSIAAPLDAAPISSSELPGLDEAAATDRDREQPRSLWLRRARQLGLRALRDTLPEVAASDPAGALQDPFVAGQLRGEMQLFLVLGVRLEGLADCRARARDLPLRLVAAPGGRAVWERHDSKRESVDLRQFAIDADAWGRIRALRHALAASPRDGANEQRREEYERLLRAGQDELGLAVRKLLAPATQSFVYKRLAASGLPQHERDARLWLLGYPVGTRVERPWRARHPDTLAMQLRDVADARRAAGLLADELRARRRDARLWMFLEAEEQLRRLAPAFDAYLERYGAEDFGRYVVGICFRSAPELAAALSRSDPALRARIGAAAALPPK